MSLQCEGMGMGTAVGLRRSPEWVEVRFELEEEMLDHSTFLYDLVAE